MPSPASPTFRVISGAESGTADLLVVSIFDADTPEQVAAIDTAPRDALAAALQARETTGALFELWWSPVAAAAGISRVAAIGAGPRDRWNPEVARRVAGAAALAARQRRLTRLALLLRGEMTARLAQAIAEGVTLAQFDSGHMKSSRPDLPALQAVTLVVPGLAGDQRAAFESACERGRVLADCTNLARALGNEPSNVLTPTELARRAEEAAAGTSLSVSVLDEGRIRELKMGLLMGVSQGSAQPPRVIVLRHEPRGVTEGPVLALVGKGITFDTGGISIKPADGMERMKVDMAGGAAVIAALRAVSLLNAPIRVIGIVPTAENMPGGRAIKPGDVVRGASGKTVEVINTDAEGRLILGDGLWYARELGATHLVDIATLTGACVVALGRMMAGLFGGPPEFLDRIHTLGELTGDRCWPMPSGDEYFDQLKSDVADMTNTGGRPGGAVTAAVFLKQFTGGLPWAHLDIAGVAWADDARPYQVKGATGAATRLLAELALGWGTD
jgi:leucyl aminopeptidase